MTMLDSSLLERAARAMYDNVQPDWDWHDPDAEPMRKMYRDNARASLLAIMEPSPAMVAKGEAKQGQGSIAIWQAMLAALLQGG